MMSDSRSLNAEIDEQAALWFSRSQARRLTNEEQQQLDTWLQIAPSHAEAYRQMQQIWGECALIPRPVSAPQPKKYLSRWRPLRSCAAGLFFLVALLLPMSQLPLLLTNDIQLQTAQNSREIVLSDGTRVHVNRHSQIRVHYAKENRQLWLDQGEIFLQVASNKTRPFLVYAGESQVKVVGTAFDVRYEKGEVAVAVKQGIVAMTGRPNMAAVMLHAGDRAQLIPEKKSLLLSQLPAAEIGEWRSGQLLFRNRPLGELLSELQRYRQGNIESTRRADIPDVVVPTTRGQSEKIISDVVTSGTTDKAEKIVPDEVKVEKQPQPATTVSKARPPLIEKEKPVIDDEIDSSSASIVDAVSIPPLTDKPVPPVIPVPASSVEYKVNSQANEVPSKAPVKKTTYQLNSQGGYFGTQGNVLPSYKDVPVVALTNGAISGSSQSSSYRKSGMRYLAQKNASPTAVELADARKAKETESTQAPKSLNASGSEFMGISSEVIDLFQKHNDASSVKNMDKAQSKVLGSVSPTRQRLSYEQLTQGGKYKEVLGSILKEQDNDKLVSVDQQDKASASGASV